LSAYEIAFLAWNLLVEEHYIRFPYFVWRKSEDPNTTIVCFVPLQLIVTPHLKKAERIKVEHRNKPRAIKYCPTSLKLRQKLINLFIRG
jgi:hypothetical protein